MSSRASLARSVRETGPGRSIEQPSVVVPVPLYLPFPPSVNRIWRAHKGRNIKSKDYRAWQAEAGTKLLLQRPERHEGPVSIVMTFALPDKRRRDIDNLPKSILDLLVHHQVIQRDDCEFVRQLTLAIGEGFEGVRVVITPVEAA